MDRRDCAAVSLSLFTEEGLLCPSPSVDRIQSTGSPRGTGSVGHWGPMHTGLWCAKGVRQVIGVQELRVPVPDQLQFVTPIVDPRHMSLRTRHRRRRGWMRFVYIPHLLVELLTFLLFSILLNHYDVYRIGSVVW